MFEPNLIIGETQVPEGKDSLQEFRAVPREGPSSPCYVLVPLLTRAGLPLGTVPAGSVLRGALGSLVPHVNAPDFRF